MKFKKMGTMKGRSGILVILAMMIFSVTTSAQAVKASIGVTGGGVGTVVFSEEPAYLNAYYGGFLTMKFGRAIGVRAGVSQMMQGVEYNLSNVDYTAEQTYLNIPVTLLLNASGAMAFEFGLYKNMLMDSKLIKHESRDKETSPDRGAQLGHIGAIAGVNFNLGRAVYLSFKYHHGLSDMYVINRVGYSSRFVTAGLGINIINTKKRAFR